VWFTFKLTIENRGRATLGAAGWHLNFSFVHRILNEGEGDSGVLQNLTGQGLRAGHADKAQSGDYWVVEPLATFKPLKPGEKRDITILGENWGILKTDAPAGFHVAFDGENVAHAVPATIVIDANDPRQTTRFSGDVLPVQTPALRLAENPARQELSLADRLLPRPLHLDQERGALSLRGRVVIEHSNALASEAAYLQQALETDAGASVARCNADRDNHHAETTIRLTVDRHLDVDGDGKPDAEAYTLDVDANHVAIRGSDAAGVFHGIQTLRQLVPVDTVMAAAGHGHHGDIALPHVHIADMPGFEFRGMHLDVGRHFHPKEEVEKILDLMAFLKLNKFHIHLTDDEGWRLEIPGLPELTGFGAHRGFDIAETNMLHHGFGSSNDLGGGDNIVGKPASETAANGGVAPAFQGFESATVNFVGKGDGFYTTRDFEEILTYATERHIEVIPEIDVPGHARAAVQAMEHRFKVFEKSDPAKAKQFRLKDPDDTSKHTSVQFYTDNFLNPCMDSTYAFLSKVVTEIKARYAAVPGAKLGVIHGGGDELPALGPNVWWQGSPICQNTVATKGMSDTDLFNRFFTRWSKIIAGTGAEMTGWDDIIHDGLSIPGFIAMPWSNVWFFGREDDAYIYANQGTRVILASASNLYMDLAYNKDPDEIGYYWANFVDEKKTFEFTPYNYWVNATIDRMGNAIDPATWDSKVHLNPAAKKNIMGMEGLLWSENMKTEELVEYAAFPKLLGIAERAWNPDPALAPTAPESWARFANGLGQEFLPRLGVYRPVDLRNELPRTVGVNYRIPLPGAVITSGKLTASVRYPGMAIEFSTDGGRTWKDYQKPVSVSGQVSLRTRTPDGRTSRIATVK
jgi:hexosaminidase